MLPLFFRQSFQGVKPPSCQRNHHVKMTRDIGPRDFLQALMSRTQQVLGEMADGLENRRPTFKSNHLENARLPLTGLRSSGRLSESQTASNFHGPPLAFEAVQSSTLLDFIQGSLLISTATPGPEEQMVLGVASTPETKQLGAGVRNTDSVLTLLWSNQNQRHV